MPETPEQGLQDPARDAGEDAPEALLEEAIERRESVVNAAQHGLRLDKLLVSMAGEFSRSHLQTLIEAGHVVVDGRAQTSTSRKVQAGQAVQVDLVPTQESKAFRAEPMSLSIVFEDAHLMVVDKPAGLVVHPAAGNWSGTLLNGLLAHHAGAANLPRAGIVHRLDKDTSGLMVVGKTLPCVTALVRQIAARDVKRVYLALCHGAFDWVERRIEAPVGRDPRSRIRMAVVSSGKPAATDVERLAVADDADGEVVSAIRCTLQTGRTHQIRVHLASLGHPLLADSVYGGRPILALQRQALHAHRLAFQHPVTSQPMTFESTLPRDLESAWRVVLAAGPDTHPPLHSAARIRQ